MEREFGIEGIGYEISNLFILSRNAKPRGFEKGKKEKLKPRGKNKQNKQTNK